MESRLSERGLPPQRPFRLGPWRVYPDRNELVSKAGRKHIEPMSMRLLLLLAENAPRTTTREEMIERLWPMRAVTDDALNKQLSKLRSAVEVGDGAERLIDTVPKVGARLVVAPEGFDEPAAARRERRWRLGVLLALAAVSAPLVVVGILASRGHQPVRIAHRRATAIPGSEIDPALSADGSWLAYSARAHPTDRFGIYIRRADGDEAQRITADDVDGRAAAWAADGRLAWVRLDAGGCAIMVGRPESGFRAVRRCIAAQIGGLSWVGADQLALSDRPGDGQSFRIELLDLRGGSTDVLTRPPAGDAGDLRPVYDAATRTIYFLRTHSVGPSEINDVELGTRQIRELSQDGVQINGLSLGPGRSIYVSTMRAGNSFALWQLDPSHRRWTYLAPGSAPHLTSSSDGQRLIYVQEDNQAVLWRARTDQADEGEALAPSTGIDWSPVLAPDRKTLAFLSNRSGSEEVWLTSIQGGQARRLTHFGGPEIQDLAWARDGRALAVSVPSDGQFDLYLVNVPTGAATRLFDTRQDERQPYFSADGSEIRFIRRDGSHFELIGRDLVSGRERALRGDVLRAQPTTVGDDIYFARPFRPGLFKGRLSGATADQVAPWPTAAGSRNFTADGPVVWGLVRAPSGSGALMQFVPDKGIRQVRLLPAVARRSGIAVGDGWVVYAREIREESDLVELRIVH
jgi:Tol biopolymer transport system component/DNA-binding winged helix-turn-helix (wHTH) protein